MKNKILTAAVIFIIIFFSQNSKTLGQEINFGDSTMYTGLRDSALTLMSKSSFICCSSDWCNQNNRRDPPTDPSGPTSPTTSRGTNVCPNARHLRRAPVCGECSTAVVRNGTETGTDMGIYRVSDAGIKDLCAERDLLGQLKLLQDSVSANIRGIENLKIKYESEVIGLLSNTVDYSEKNMQIINLKRLELQYKDLEEYIKVHNEIVADLMKQYIDDTIK